MDSPSPFSYFKGIIENIWKRMDIRLQTQYTGHPTMSEGIEWKIGNNTLGRMGIVLSGITKKFDITKTVFFAELDWDILLKHAFKKIRHSLQSPNSQEAEEILRSLYQRKLVFKP